MVARGARPVGPRQTDFGRQVREALAHLHDLAYLRAAPVARALTHGPPGRVSAGREVQARLLDAIAALRPEPGPSAGAAWRGYELLRLRYIEALSVAEVRDLLGIGNSQYHREHARWLDAAVALLQDEADRSARMPWPVDMPQPPTRMLGRDRDLAAVSDLLAGGRVVTLTGPPGVGKTTLALEVAAAVAS